MTVRVYNGLQIDVPDVWADVSTVIVAPKAPLLEGKKPPVNLVVKRRPCEKEEIDASLQKYLRFMQAQFGALVDVQQKDMLVGAMKGKAVQFEATHDGKKFRQITLLYHAGGEEISATVTQLDGDATSLADIEKLLRSVKPMAAGVRGLR